MKLFKGKIFRSKNQLVLIFGLNKLTLPKGTIVRVCRVVASDAFYAEINGINKEVFLKTDEVE